MPEAPRKSRQVGEREIAKTLLLELARTRTKRFSLTMFFPEDIEFVAALIKRLCVVDDKAWRSKLRRVCRRLVRYNVLLSSMTSNHGGPIDAPCQQMEYELKGSWSSRLAPDLYPGHPDAALYGRLVSPGEAADTILRRAYPSNE